MGGKFEQVVNGNASEENSALKFSHLRLSGGLRFNLVWDQKFLKFFVMVVSRKAGSGSNFLGFNLDWISALGLKAFFSFTEPIEPTTVLSL